MPKCHEDCELFREIIEKSVSNGIDAREALRYARAHSAACAICDRGGNYFAHIKADVRYPKKEV